MEKKELKERFFRRFFYAEDGSHDWDRWKNQDPSIVLEFISQELDKAREEGREEVRQLLRDKKQMQEYLKKHPKFYKGEKIPTATSNLIKRQ